MNVRTQKINKITLIRFFFYFSVFCIDYSYNLTNLQNLYPIFTEYFYLQLPVGLVNFLYPIKYLFLISCLACAFSMQVRWTSLAACVFGFLFYGIIHSAGFADRVYFLVMHILILFAVYDWGHLITRKQFIFLGQLCLVLVFFQSGLTKLTKIGLEWATGLFVQDYMLLLRYSFSKDRYNLEAQDLSLYFIRNYENYKYIFGGVMWLELLSPFVLLKRFQYFIFAFIAFQIGVYFILGISFLQFMGAYCFFLIPLLYDIRKRISKNV